MRTDAILGETLVAFKQGGKLAANPSADTLLRWALKGLKNKKNPDGSPITLEYCYVGGRLFTSIEAHERWLKKINQT